MLKDYNNVAKTKVSLARARRKLKTNCLYANTNTKFKTCLRFIFTIFITCMFLSIGMYEHVRKGVREGQRLLELELQVLVSFYFGFKNIIHVKTN